jgi:DNA repair exonuclease SbcCD ATPase subunit
MILRGIHVEHWRCVGKLDLDALPPGVIVLSGPNRTGKSSLVAALRATLYDYDHNARCKELEQAVPWNTKHSPKVTIEFAVSGQEYQLTKVFSPRKDGGAVLKRKAGGNWTMLEEAPKEASRKTRELLGIDASNAGLNQLLWLDQGTIHLPKPKDFDTSLQQQLLQILGVLITGRDQAFKDTLDKHCSHWFTPTTGNYKKTSEVTRLEQLKTQCQTALEEEEKKFREVEADERAQYVRLDERPQLEVLVKDAEREVSRLDKEQADTRERRRLFAEAEREVATTRSTHDTASQNWTTLQEAKKRCKETAGATRQCAEQVRLAEGDAKRLTTARDLADQQVQTVKDQGTTIQQDQDELADYRQLGNLEHQRNRSDKDLGKARELESDIEGLEKQIRNVAAPTEQQLRDWRKNRTDATELRARIDAAALNLTLELESSTRAEIAVDGAAPLIVDLPGGESRSFPLRQRASVNLVGVGRIEAARTHADQSLEASAQQLQRLNGDFQAAMRSYNEDPADERCVENLSRRLHTREADLGRLKQLRKDITAIAPDGIPVLQGQLDGLNRQMELLVQRRPAFGDGPFVAAEADQREVKLSDRMRDWKKALADAETAAQAARTAAEKAEKAVQAVARLHAAAEATEKTEHEGLQRLGDESALAEFLKNAESALGTAQEKLTAASLTPDELTIDERCQSAKHALDQRKKRLTELDAELSRLRGKLEGSEGLHTRRTDAANALQEVTTRLERETLEAQAHNHLRELFVKCREYQVQRVVGPISARVLEWAKHLGLNDYREMRFGDQFLPEGFFPQNVTSDEPIGLLEESYGTVEQLALLVRLALGGVLATKTQQVAILDDPLTHADTTKHRRFLEILKMAAEAQVTGDPPAGALQILILTCHPDRFDHLPGATQINLAERIIRET